MGATDPLIRLSAARLFELFEASSPLAQRLAGEAPFESDTILIERARAHAAILSEPEKVQTLNAHPRIGEDPARLSRRSLAEQGADALPDLAALNAEYERRFGFRFVVFVNGRSKAEIVPVLRERLRNSREEEMGNGLEAIIAIAEARASAPSGNELDKARSRPSEPRKGGGRRSAPEGA
jgi:2-oxo-4-hydroxy-4-carboxy--5-ureidoimidazoline (OHCU) decarboxylase